MPAGTAAWTYNDAAVGLLGPILTRACDGDLEAWAARQLLRPLGIEHWSWARDRRDVALTWRGLRLRGRDAARLGAVMAGGGRWKGQRLPGADWVADSLRPHGAADWQVAPALQLAVSTSAVEPPPHQLLARNRDVMALVARVVALYA